MALHFVGELHIILKPRNVHICEHSIFQLLHENSFLLILVGDV